MELALASSKFTIAVVDNSVLVSDLDPKRFLCRVIGLENVRAVPGRKGGIQTIATSRGLGITEPTASGLGSIRVAEQEQKS